MGVKAKKKKIKKQLRLKGISGKIKPTAQDIRIAAEIIKPGAKKGEALIAAGVSPASARSNSAEILGRPGVRAALAIALEDAGVTTDRIAQVLNDGLSATKIISANLLIQSTKSYENLPCKDGCILDATEETEESKQLIRVEDHAVRHKYLETSCKLLNLFPTEGSVITEERVTMTEERNLIDQAERSAESRNTARYMVRREKQQI